MSGVLFTRVVPLVKASFSAVFRACARAQRLNRFANEMTWRQEHDNLFTNFFVRELGAGHLVSLHRKMEAHANGILEDPSAHAA